MDQLRKCTDEELVRALIVRLGDDPSRDGLADTPRRVVATWKELYRGYQAEQKPAITVFKNGQDGVAYDEMIIDSGTFSSVCEHHMLPFSGTYVFGYIPAPKGNVLGLSKVARVVQYCSARLQIQERLTSEVVKLLWEALAHEAEEVPRGMALVLRATHLCKSMRGVRAGGVMSTIQLRGLFKQKEATRAEFMQIVHAQNL